MLGAQPAGRDRLTICKTDTYKGATTELHARTFW